VHENTFWRSPKRSELAARSSGHGAFMSKSRCEVTAHVVANVLASETQLTVSLPRRCKDWYRRRKDWSHSFASSNRLCNRFFNEAGLESDRSPPCSMPIFPFGTPSPSPNVSTSTRYIHVRSAGKSSQTVSLDTTFAATANMDKPLAC
jgi:hypothetical protein